jgi:hypothetical protein
VDIKPDQVILMGEDAIPVGVRRLTNNSPLYPRR